MFTGAMPVPTEAAMADDQQQDDQQDETQGDEQKDGTGKADDTRGDADKPSAALLKALQEERDGRRKAESALRKIDTEKRQAETERAIKAGELDTVVKSQAAELAEKDTRIAALEAEIATSKLETVRERVAAKHKLPPQLAARLRGDDEAGLDADAKELAKLVAPPPAGNTELGKGGDRSGKPTDQELVEQLRKSGRYASVG